MAVFSTRPLERLARGLIFAPERYDPRRSLPSLDGDQPLGDLVQLARNTVSPRSAPKRCLVVDTTHARCGILALDRGPVDSIGSTKKLAKPGDLIISRLRPYLRQVAWIDPEAPGREEGLPLLCSTEFYVLSPRVGDGGNTPSIAFLVPYLLSEAVQSALAAAQEGGHHPRFDADTLLELPVPASLLDERETISREVAEACRAYRRSDATLERLRSKANRALSSRKKSD